MLPDRHSGGLVDRVVADLRAAREPVYDPTDPIQVAAVERLRSETGALTPGERLVASVEASVRAYRRGRAEGLTDFAQHLRGMARRGVNERVTESLLAIADIADRVAAGERPRRYCPGCKADVDNHFPCGEINCSCWCMDPDTPEHMKRPPQYGGLS